MCIFLSYAFHEKFSGFLVFKLCFSLPSIYLDALEQEHLDGRKKCFFFYDRSKEQLFWPWFPWHKCISVLCSWMWSCSGESSVSTTVVRNGESGRGCLESWPCTLPIPLHSPAPTPHAQPGWMREVQHTERSTQIPPSCQQSSVTPGYSQTDTSISLLSFQELPIASLWTCSFRAALVWRK